MIRAALFPLLLAATPSFADFTENNLIAIFYHELGHAIVDQMQMPIFGQEEDAADALSILLIDALYDSESAEAIAYDSAALFWAEAQGEPSFWDVHGPDEQRFYNTVCLFYGADPHGRDDFATELGLPKDRAEGCEEEFALASESWNAVLDEMSADSDDRGVLVLNSSEPPPVFDAEIQNLNEEFKWPRSIVVNLESCGEANAFYDPFHVEITICSELSGWLDGIAKEIGLR